MPEPLKNIYNPQFFEGFTRTMKEVWPAFQQQCFINHVFDQHWQDKELKQRMRQIAAVLQQQLPGNYHAQLSLLLSLIKKLKAGGAQESFPYMFIPDFVEQFGLDDPETSLTAMEEITQFTSCEFAIRPFLLQYPEMVLAKMLEWSKHPHAHVRRFASEGCRPRLPWAMAIPFLKKDPAPVLPILDNLKNDSSLFVRKSVANHLNDIAKDHPEVVIRLVKKWKGISSETDWIIRHGCRTLLKQAYSEAYALFGLKDQVDCIVSGFRLSDSRIRIGDRLGFSFRLKAATENAMKLRLEYAIYYRKSNQRTSRKIFQLKQHQVQPGVEYAFKKEQRFEDFTTRKHYPGKHRLAIIVNGKEVASKDFTLTP